MRLFAAINFGPDVHARLLALQSELRAKSQRGNFTVPENVHLTLVFLGECNEKQTTDAKAAMDALSFEAFAVEIDRIGCFERDDGNIWWVGVRESRPLLTLQRELTDKLTFKGFALQRRKYNPHITLGRKVEGNIAGWEIEPFNETAASIELMKSERVHGKLMYTAIHRKVARLI